MNTDKKIEELNEYCKILNDYITIEDGERPFVGNIGMLIVMSEIKKEFQSQLLSLGKEILKHQSEMYNPVFRVEAVPVSEIVKAFENLGVKIEEKTDF
jgi:hypothetical protein